MKVQYLQCALTREDGDKIYHQVAWLPVRYAEEKKVVDLHGEQWTVGIVYNGFNAIYDDEVEEKIEDGRRRFPSTEGR